MVTSAPNGYQRYLKTTIETASQPQLLVMLFDAAVKKLHMARKAMENKEIETTHNELIKVQRIFSELMVALDFDMGGELAQQLFAIYDFVYRQLVQANIRRDTKLIDEVMPIVEDLREGWTKAVAKYQEESKEGAVPDQSAVRVAVSNKESSPNQPVPKPKEEAVQAEQPKKFSPISPAQYAKPRSYTNPKKTETTTEEPPRPRLNIRG